MLIENLKTLLPADFAVKFVLKLSLMISPYFKRVAKLPYEMLTSENLQKS